MRKGNIYNKRAVSAVVATVLIVMITVAAVGLLWAIVAPFLKSTVADKTACFDAEKSISIDSGSANTCFDSTNGTAVRISRGSDDVDWVGVQVVYTLSNGDSVLYNYNSTGLNVNSEKVFRNNVTIDVVGVSVSPILISSSGKYLLCSKGVEVPNVRSCTPAISATITDDNLAAQIEIAPYL